MTPASRGCLRLVSRSGPLAWLKIHRRINAPQLPDLQCGHASGPPRNQNTSLFANKLKLSSNQMKSTLSKTRFCKRCNTNQRTILAVQLGQHLSIDPFESQPAACSNTSQVSQTISAWPPGQKSLGKASKMIVTSNKVKFSPSTLIRPVTGSHFQT